MSDDGIEWTFVSTGDVEVAEDVTIDLTVEGPNSVRIAVALLDHAEAIAEEQGDEHDAGGADDTEISYNE